MTNYSILKSRSFIVGGIVACAWPLVIFYGEISACHPGWMEICGAGLAFFHPIGLLISFPFIMMVGGALSTFEFFSEDHKTLHFILGTVLPVLGVHYLLGGYIWSWIQKKRGIESKVIVFPSYSNPYPYANPYVSIKKILIKIKNAVIHFWKYGP